MTALLRLENLRKHIGDRLLLDIGTFEIDAGTCLVLSGRNGAGKSTLLKILAGLEPAARLEVFYRGLTRARVLSPALLLLDEPFAGMDRESREQTLFFIRRLRRGHHHP